MAKVFYLDPIEHLSGKIAKKHRTTIANLKKWNNLRSDKIREGQRLKVGRR